MKTRQYSWRQSSRRTPWPPETPDTQKRSATQRSPPLLRGWLCQRCVTHRSRILPTVYKPCTPGLEPWPAQGAADRQTGCPTQRFSQIRSVSRRQVLQSTQGSQGTVLVLGGPMEGAHHGRGCVRTLHARRWIKIQYLVKKFCTFEHVVARIKHSFLNSSQFCYICIISS